MEQVPGLLIIAGAIILARNWDNLTHEHHEQYANRLMRDHSRAGLKMHRGWHAKPTHGDFNSKTMYFRH